MIARPGVTANPGNPAAAAAIRQQASSQQTPAQRALEEQLLQTPEWVAYERELAQGFTLGSSQTRRALEQRAKALGLPEDWQVGIHGNVAEKGWIEKHPVLYAALVTGGALAGAAAIPAIAGAGAASGGGAGAASTADTSVGAAGIGGGAPVLAAGGAASSAPAWLNAGSWQGQLLNTGINAASTYLENRGRQQAADTLAGAAERAGANTQQATNNSLNFAQLMQARTQPYLQNPGPYQPGSSTPQGPSFAQMGAQGQPPPRNTSQTPQGFTDSYLSGLPSAQLQSDLNNPSDPAYADQVKAEMARRQQGGQGGAAPTGQYLQQLLSSGMNPQEAVAKFNADTGRTTGNEAVLYGAEVHGKPTIGLPGSYLSLEGNGWQETQRSPEGPRGGMSFASMMGGGGSQGVVPQLQQAPGAYQPVSFANMMTVKRPDYLMPQFQYPNPGQRM